MRQRACRWRCGRLTDRICGICLQCCNERDERDRQIDAGAIAYVPPDQRPGHRFYKADKPKRVLSDAHKQALTSARMAKFIVRITGAGPITAGTEKTKGDVSS